MKSYILINGVKFIKDEYLKYVWVGVERISKKDQSSKRSRQRLKNKIEWKQNFQEYFVML